MNLTPVCQQACELTKRAGHTLVTATNRDYKQDNSVLHSCVLSWSICTFSWKLLSSFACFSFFKPLAVFSVFSYSFKSLFNCFLRMLMANSSVHQNTFFSSSSAKQSSTCNSQGADDRTSAPHLLHEAFYLAIRQLSTRATSALFTHQTWRLHMHFPYLGIIL